MKIIAAALLVLGGTSAVATPSRPYLQYFPAPALQGRPAAWSSAVRVGDFLYLAGQIGIGPDGKLPDTFQGQAKQTMENVGATLKAHGLGWSDVFKCTVFVVDMKNWPAFNAVYVPYFPSGRLPARSAVGVTGLSAGAQVELECIAYAGKK